MGVDSQDNVRTAQTNTQSRNINRYTQKIYMVDRCTRRQQTYEMALLCEDECLSVAFEIDGGENALKVNRAAKVHSGM